MDTTPGASRKGYWEWTFSGESPSHRYLVPGILKALANLHPQNVLDIGCGNGLITARVAQIGCQVMGIDFTPTGIERARTSFPGLAFESHDISEPLPATLQHCFDTVISAEVIEHLFLPRDLFTRAREALDDRGHVLITTPYHGYFKNLALAASNQFDQHWAPGSDYGHIKFFSKETLSEVMDECGFDLVGFTRVGRIPPLAASMIMVGRLR